MNELLDNLVPGTQNEFFNHICVLADESGTVLDRARVIPTEPAEQRRGQRTDAAKLD